MDNGDNQEGGIGEDLCCDRSGVISLRQADSVEKKLSGQEQEVERLLKEADIFRVRMEIRNSLRKWYEKIPLVAKICNVPILPPMTAQQVYDEHSKIVERKVARAAFSFQGDYPADVLLVLEEGYNLNKDEVTLKNEEYAKYVTQKFELRIKSSGYCEGANYVLATLASMKDESAKGVVYDIVKLKAGEIVADLIRSKKFDEAVKAFFELGRICRFEREDFFEISDHEMGDPELKRAFLKELARTIGIDADLGIFTRVREHMEEVGFLKKGEAEVSDEVVDAAKKWFSEAVNAHAILYREVVNVLGQAGLDKVIEGERDRCALLLKSRLIKMMRQSPGLYATIQNRWKSWGVLSDDDLEEEKVLEALFNEHLQRCFDQHPYLYNKVKRHWLFLGLRENLAEEQKRQQSVNWSYGVKFEGDKFDDTITSDFEREKAREQILIAAEDEMQQTVLVGFMLECSNKCRKFELMYPQYASGNCKKGDKIFF